MIKLNKDIHIWLLSLGKSVAIRHQIFASLSAEEINRAHNLIDKHLQQQFALSHYFMRRVLGHYLQIKPGEIKFEASPTGKPRLASHLNYQHLKFNMSHSHELVILAIGEEREVGIDLEYMKPNIEWQTIAREYFTSKEQKQLFALPNKQQTRAFYQTWVRKESHMKVTGRGLQLSPETFEVSMYPEAARFCSYLDDTPQQQWQMQDVELDSFQEDYCACLSVEKGFDGLQFFNAEEEGLL